MGVGVTVILLENDGLTMITKGAQEYTHLAVPFGSSTFFLVLLDVGFIRTFILLISPSSVARLR